jgi:hypothetical protein
MPTETGASGAGGSGAGGGGGGDASAAKQDEQTALLQSIADASDIPLSDVVTAVEALGDGATIAQIVSLLTTDATTQASILAKLTSIDSTLTTQFDAPISSVVSGLSTLHGDVDGVETLLGQIKTGTDKIPTSPAQDRTTFGAPSAVRIANAGASGFVTPLVVGDNLLADLRVAGSLVTVSNPVFVRLSDGSGAISVALDSTLTQGLQKSIVRGGAKGSTTAADVTSTSSGSNHNALDVVIYDASGNVLGVSANALVVDSELPAAVSLSDTMSSPTAPAVGAWAVCLNLGSGQGNRVPGTSTGGWYVQGNTNDGSNLGTVKPVTVGGKDGSGNARALLTDSSSRLVVVGPGATTAATSVSSVQATNNRTANGAPTELTAATSLTTTATKLLTLELRYTHAGNKFVWIFDKANTTVTAADAACIPIPIANSDGKVIVDLSTAPLNLANGCVVSLSSTETTYTVDATGFYARGTWQ